MKENRQLSIIENVRKFDSREYEGSLLNDLGYTFFEPGKEYTIWQSDYPGLYLVFTYDSEDSRDEDGFGAEIYYDWWFLDEHLQQIPGTQCVNAAFREIRFSRFISEKARAIELLKKRSEA